MPEMEPLRREITLPKTYKGMVLFAVKHDGVFSFSEYERHLDAEVFTAAKCGDKAPKLKAQELKWKRTSIQKMLHDGVFVQISDDAFRLNPDIAEILKKPERPQKEFKLGNNHIKLLRLHINGIITPEALGAAINAKSLPEADRQRKIQKGMVKNLAANGYLEKQPDGCFSLTQKSAELLQESFMTNADDLKLLKLHENGVIKSESLEKSLKGDDKQKEKQQRQLKSLADGGYVVRYGKDFILMPKATEFVKGADKSIDEQKEKMDKTGGFKITGYDTVFAMLATKDRFTIEDVEAQPNADRLKARLKQLISKLLIKEDGRDAFTLSDEFKDRLHVLNAENKFRAIKSDVYLLDLAKGGVRIDKADLDVDKLNESLQRRFKEMLRRRLIREELGSYTLTGDLADMLKEVKARGSFSVNRFDLAFRDISTDGRFTKAELATHPRAPSLEKRLNTLKEHEMITVQDGRYTLTDVFLDRLAAAENMSIDHSLSLDVFTKEQKDMLRDMAIFSQLTEWQIYCYIYGRRRDLMNGDLRRLIKKKVIDYDPVQKVYTPTGLGTAFALKLSGKERYYKSKAKSRPEEIAHDVLVYEAYRDMLRKLEAQGCEIGQVENRYLKSSSEEAKWAKVQFTKVETDREMRSRINSVPMGTAVLEQIPDMRLYFKTPDGKEDYINIEIDCGYSATTVERKIAGLAHNGAVYWYASDKKTAARAIKAATKLGFKAVRDAAETPTGGTGTAKALYITIVEDDLSTHKVAFKEGRRSNAFSKQKQPT